MGLLFKLFRKPKRKGFWHIKKSKNDKFYFVLKAANNKTILQSEIYESFQAAWNGIESIKENVNTKIIWNWQ